MKIVRGILTGLAALALSGCALYVKPKVPEEFSVVPEYRVGIDAFYARADVSKSLRTTPVHPDDSSFLSGETTTGNPRGLGSAVKAGIAASAGTPGFRVYAGGDLKYGAFSAIGARKQQDSDPRPESQGSFVDTRLIPVYTVLPLVGVEAALGSTVLRAEAGVPYSKYKVESGHERFGKFKKVQEESWKGKGVHVRGDVLFRISEDWRFGGSVGYEHFDAEFAGEKSDIESILGFLQLEYRF